MSETTGNTEVAGRNNALVMRKSREGNDIPDMNADIRAAIHYNCDGESSCPGCLHILDLCKEQRKSKKMVDGHVCITSCGGFESIYDA